MVFFERKIYVGLKEHLQKRQVTVITGMRRTGKTTLVRQLLSEIVSENKLYLDLERVDNREIFLEKNYENTVRALSERGIDFSKKCFIALDETQLVPEISSVLKYIYDNHNVKFIVTGSSSYYLKGLFTESLAGRKKIFELFPLDFGEFLVFKKISFVSHDFSKKKFSTHEFERLKSYYEEFIEFGGFPEVVLSESVSDKKDILSDILSSYINIDIKSLSDFRDSKNVYNLMKLLASRIGTKLDYSKLSKLSGLSRATVLNYVEFFEKTYLIQRLHIFARHPDREIVKAQKIYFSDTGIVGMLFDSGSGTKFENAVFCQLRHKGELQYYSLKSGKEIDFVLDKKKALEVKESPLNHNLLELKKLANFASIKEFRLIGKNKVPKFEDYIWGGDIK